MPSVVSTRRREWFMPVNCQLCDKALGNVPALASHLRTHMIDTRTNPNAITLSPTTMGRHATSLSSVISSSTPSSYAPNNNFQHQSLLSPSSFSLFETSGRSWLSNNPHSSRHHHHHHHRAALSPSLGIHKPNTGFRGQMGFYNNIIALTQTPPSLYNVVNYNNTDANRCVQSDGITRPFINLLDRPVPVIIELDSDGEDDDDQNREGLYLNLKL